MIWVMLVKLARTIDWCWSSDLVRFTTTRVVRYDALDGGVGYFKHTTILDEVL